VTGIIRRGRRPRRGQCGVFFSQPGELGFQVGDALAKTVQFGGYALVRPADLAEESLRHDGSSSLVTAGVTDSMPSRAGANQVHCLWRWDGEVHVVFTAAAPHFHADGRQ